MVDFNNFNPSEHSGDDKAPIVPGEFVMWCKGFNRANRNGKEQIDFIMIAILDAERNRVPADQFAPVWETCTLTDAAAWRLANLLDAVGATPPVNVMSDDSLSAAVKFQPFRAKIERDSYNGKDRAKIARFLQLSAIDKKAAQELSEDRGMDDSIDGGGYEASGGGSVGNNGGNNGGGFQDDDIPF